MLAVLPFQNMSNDRTQEYFSDGLTEETITDLRLLSPEQLGVIARTSAMAYKHTNKTDSQIGQELDPLSLPINNFMGMTYMFAENYEKAYQQFQHTIARDPTFPLAHQYFSWLERTLQTLKQPGGKSVGPAGVASDALGATRTAPSSGWTKLTQYETARTSCC
jgi:hypothetical protein